MNADLKELDKREMGRRIRVRREKLGMSREMLADLIDATPQHVAAVEYGDRGLSIEKLYLLSQALDISIDALFSAKREKPGETAEKEKLMEETIGIVKGVSSLSEAEELNAFVSTYVDSMRKRRSK